MLGLVLDVFNLNAKFIRDQSPLNISEATLSSSESPTRTIGSIVSSHLTVGEHLSANRERMLGMTPTDS